VEQLAISESPFECEMYGRADMITAVGALMLWEGDAIEMNEVAGVFQHHCRSCTREFDAVNNRWVLRDPQTTRQQIAAAIREFRTPRHKGVAADLCQQNGIHACKVMFIQYY
jgi:hypothetical protein